VALVSRAQKTDSRPTPKAAPNQRERRCRQFSDADFWSTRLAEASLDELAQLQALARQCVGEATPRVRLAAFDAYDHIIGEQYDRIELAVAKAQKEEHDAKAKEQQDNLDLVVRFANQTSVENATLVTKYNALVNQYNELVRDNRNLHDLAQQAINLGQQVINAYSNQPVYPTLPAVSAAPPAQPLFCTARTFDLGVGMQTTYMNCH